MAGPEQRIAEVAMAQAAAQAMAEKKRKAGLPADAKAGPSKARRELITAVVVTVFLVALLAASVALQR